MDAYFTPTPITKTKLVPHREWDVLMRLLTRLSRMQNRAACSDNTAFAEQVYALTKRVNKQFLSN